MAAGDLPTGLEVIGCPLSQRSAVGNGIEWQRWSRQVDPDTPAAVGTGADVVVAKDVTCLGPKHQPTVRAGVVVSLEHCSRRLTTKLSGPRSGSAATAA